MNYIPADRSFEDRVRDFLEDIANEQGFKIENREMGHNVKYLKVGIGQNEGLVYKIGKVAHARKAIECYDKLMDHFKERGYEPYSYELVKPNFIAVGERVCVVQEYFCEPSLSELWSYFVMLKEIKKRERKLHRELNPDEMKEFWGRFVADKNSGLRCEQFFNEQQNRDITLEQMAEVQREFKCDKDFLYLQVKSDNVIVLGQRKNKIGLVMVDD